MVLSLAHTSRHERMIVLSSTWSRIRYTNSTGSVWSDFSIVLRFFLEIFDCIWYLGFFLYKNRLWNFWWLCNFLLLDENLAMNQNNEMGSLIDINDYYFFLSRIKYSMILYANVFTSVCCRCKLIETLIYSFYFILLIS